METQAKPMTVDEYKQGHSTCHCGEFTHIFRQCAMQRLQRDYSGELCPRCGLWMCKTDKLEPLAMVMPNAALTGGAAVPVESIFIQKE